MMSATPEAGPEAGPADGRSGPPTITPGSAAELKRKGVSQWLFLVGFSLKNAYFGWAFFLPSFVLLLIQMFTAAAIFYVMGQLVAPGATPEVDAYGMSYGTYIVTGVMFNLVLTTTLSAYHEAWLNGYWATQFDTYLQHPGGVSAYLAGSVLFSYLMAAINTVAYVLVGVAIFGVSVDVPHLPMVLVILVAGVFSLTGLGLLGASTFSLLGARNWGQNPVEWLVGFGVALLAGVYFPPSALPAWLQPLSEWLPQTHAIRAARLALNGQSGLDSPALWGDLAFLLVFGAVSLPLGVLAFAAGLRKVQRDGSLTRWS
jgi:ABC-type multidrug transport system permease subunit